MIRIRTKFSNYLILAMLLITPVAFGQDAAVPKIAILDMSVALFNSDMARDVNDAVLLETSDDKEKIRALADEATQLQERYQQDEAILSEDEKRSIAEDIQEIGVNYQYLTEKVETLVQQRREQFQETYAPNLFQAISEVVEEEGYDMVLRSEVALHFSSAFDITAKVTAKLNQL